MKLSIVSVLPILALALLVDAQERTLEAAEREALEELLAHDGLAKLKDQIAFATGKPERFQKDQQKYTRNDESHCRSSAIEYGCSELHELPSDEGGLGRQSQKHHFALRCEDHCGSKRSFRMTYETIVTEGRQSKPTPGQHQLVPIEDRGFSRVDTARELQAAKAHQDKASKAKQCALAKAKSMKEQSQSLLETLRAGFKENLRKGLKEEQMDSEVVLNALTADFVDTTLKNIEFQSDWSWFRPIFESDSLILAMRLLFARMERLSPKFDKTSLDRDLQEFRRAADEFASAENESVIRQNDGLKVGVDPNGEKVTCFPDAALDQFEPGFFLHMTGFLGLRLVEKLEIEETPLRYVPTQAEETRDLGSLFPYKKTTVDIDECRPRPKLVESATPALKIRETENVKIASDLSGDPMILAYQFLEIDNVKIGAVLGSLRTEEAIYRSSPSARLVTFRLKNQLAPGQKTLPANADRKAFLRMLILPEALQDAPDSKIRRVFEEIGKVYGEELEFDEKRCHFASTVGSVVVPALISNSQGDLTFFQLKNCGNR